MPPGSIRAILVKVLDFHAPRHITLDYSIANAVYSREVQHSLHNLKDSAGRLFFSFCKYLVAGGAGFLVDFSALYVCRDILGLHYLPAAAIGFIGTPSVFMTTPGSQCFMTAKRYRLPFRGYFCYS